tara:strand:- start:164 stop:628 length:465 start_codon:yes stop_codon:yes gene_type:complete
MVRLIYLMVALLGLTACAHNGINEVQSTLAMQIEADTYYADNQCDKAVPLYQSLSIALPKETKSLLRIGNCYAREKNYTLAQDAYQQAIIRDNQFIKAWHNLTYVRAQLLANTVTEMYQHIDQSSPEADQIRALTIQVLAPFDITIEDAPNVQE